MELIPAYQLLHGLVGRNELDFLIRAAALEALRRLRTCILLPARTQ